MKTLITQITDCIEHTYDIDGRDFSKNVIIYPCGDIGIQFINTMRSVYSTVPAIIVDDNKHRFNPCILSTESLSRINADDYVMILASTNPYIYKSLLSMAKRYFPVSRIIELESMRSLKGGRIRGTSRQR